MIGKLFFSFLLISSMSTLALAQELGSIKRELVDQVGVYEVVGNSQNLKVSDIVAVSRKGKKLGEATVVKISNGSFTVSLRGIFSVSVND